VDQFIALGPIGDLLHPDVGVELPRLAGGLRAGTVSHEIPPKKIFSRPNLCRSRSASFGASEINPSRVMDHSGARDFPEPR